jgi:hypothetical protein
MLLLLGCSSDFSTLPEGDPYPLPPSEEDVAGADVPPLLLNEVQTRNDSTIMGVDFDFPDWIELFNAGDTAIALSDVTLDVSGDVWEGVEGELAPGVRTVLWLDGRNLPGHAPFSLAADGEEITLSVRGVVTDRLATGEMAGDTAWARYPDGGVWAYTARPTPHSPNGRAPGRSVDPSDALFPEGEILVFELTLPETSMRSLDNDPYGEVPGSLAWGPAWFGEVGVRTKGVYGSLRSLDGKAAFKVDLNAYADHRLRGLETLTFNNMVQDPSYTHEALAYGFFRQLGLPAPRTAWMELYVNGEYWGLYLHVETVDDTFLERWWADPTGRLYEGAYGVDFTPGEEWSFEYDEGTLPDDRSDLLAVSTILDQEPTDAAVAELERWVDLDQVLLVLAAEAILWHWDGYTTANNYRVYRDPVTGQFDMIPWGTDQTLHDEWYGPYDGQGELLIFCLQNTACKARYDDALLQAADVFEAAELAAELDAYASFLRPYIAGDVRGEVGRDTITAWTDDTRRLIEAGPDRIRAVVGR